MYSINQIITLGLPLILNGKVLLLALLGTSVGLFVGAMPGLTGVMAMAILIPLTYSMTPIQAFSLLLATYVSGTYGGSISAILIKIPGTGAAIMTTLDGHPMALRGEAGKAIGLSCTYSFIGGTVSGFFLALFAPVLALWAIRLGSREYFSVAIFGLGIIAYISPTILKGLFAGVLGLLLATAGMDPINGYSRFQFGRAELIGGFEFVAVMIGLFGFGEVFNIFFEGISERKKVTPNLGKIWPSFKELLATIPVTIRSIIVGLFIGIIPASGPTIASVTSYGLEKRIGKRREQLGTGIPEGLSAVETSNNAATGAAIVPMIALGIPGDSVTAILIGALLIHGLKPGPALFISHPATVSSIFILFFLGNILFFILGMSGAKVFARLLNIPPTVLMPIITVFCFVGTYAVRSSIFDVYVAITFGLLGLLMRRIQLPIAPTILGFILSPIIEDNLRRSLIMSRSSRCAPLGR
jgi:putative tricarboxylic transport membrane protein